MNVEMPLSQRPHIAKRIADFKAATARAKEHGLDVHPNINGALLVHSATGRVAGPIGDLERVIAEAEANREATEARASWICILAGIPPAK
jgi:hypothetical protein